MWFILILFISALSIAAVAGFFSIYGLANIYVATFWSVVIMGTVLEVGKLVAASFLQRYWTTASLWLKSYLMVAVAGLMIITSAGIYGYLSNAYQQDSVGLKDVQAKMELLLTEEKELTEREAQIDADIARVGENYVRARIKLMDSYKDEKKIISERRIAIRVEKQQLASKQIEVEAHTGPIIYIAKAFDKDVDTAIKWMTLLIIIVFDPLAIALTLAGNHALMIREGNRVPPPPSPPTPLSPPPPTPSRKQEDPDPIVEKENDSSQVEESPTLTDVFIDEEPTPTVNSEAQIDKALVEHPPIAPPPPVNAFYQGQPDFLKRLIAVNRNK